MNVATSVGYGDSFPTTDTERIATMVIILIGDGMFAVIFGMMAGIARHKMQKDSFKKYLAQFKKFTQIMQKMNLTNDLQLRIEKFLAYRWAIENDMGALRFDEVLQDLPITLQENIIWRNMKEMLQTIKFLKCMDDNFLRALSQKLSPRMYQPLDYIIAQGETGDEAFFIVEGVAHVLWSVDSTISLMAVICEGDYFGEESLLFESLRTKSVVSAGYTAVYVLTKDGFNGVLDDFPDHQTYIDVVSLKCQTDKRKIKRQNAMYAKRRREQKDTIRLKHQLSDIDQPLIHREDSHQPNSISFQYLFNSKNPILFDQQLQKLLTSRKQMRQSLLDWEALEKEKLRIVDLKHRKEPSDNQLRRRKSLLSMGKQYILTNLDNSEFE